ncbi:GNAT family N-acetyltransferase [Carnobacterium maltaromaticum]|uniref:GNAT family N-acetyltransferase n=1 Tax=Carnobacterium maltaromaticum TaxID=2751 RepID=UPI001071FAF5|nr:GNAT family N-acetyltransferase [Carnobacterium maltaromaticum]TFJ72193.1 GNAT family N-acetyltransferase [Carnobacterium maltaromaticum]TFJ77106.1 GNAT family N-acetyltransferase [Carnobacterium maltaromaticum]
MSLGDQTKQFKMKSVDMQHLEQFNELLRYVFQVTNQDLQEVGYEDDDLVKAKRPVLRKADVIGWFDDEKLISQLAIYPCEVNIRGKIFKMGGLTGVGTYPEYANLGLMHHLMKESLEMMRKNGQWISYLFPYSIPYYRRKGWEIISDKMTFTFKDTQLPKTVPVTGYVGRLELDHPDVIAVYDAFARITHGALIRDELAWEEYWRWENEGERIAAVYYDENDEPTGCLFYWIAEDVFHMKEMFYINQEARKGLWNFITAHFSMIDKIEGHLYKNEPIAFILEDSEIVETIQPNFMARIVDVAEFIKEYPFEMVYVPDFHFVVEDPMLEWNQGVFGLSFNEEGSLTLTNEPIGSPVKLDIQTLTTMLMGYRRPSYLARLERIDTDSRTLRSLEQVIPQGEPYFSDYF